MRYLYLFIIIFVTFACKSSKMTNNKKPTDIEKTKKNVLIKRGGKLEVLQNKHFEIATDGIGAMYPKITEGKSVILKFTYTKNINPEYQDSGYTEEVYITFNPENPIIKFSGKALENVNFLFGRLCYCKGQSGYYIIDEGTVEISKLKDQQYKLSATFRINKVPQVITEIEEVFTLK